ncbi:hypothetical protein [Cellulomonas xiejunii]|uniref:hypothetical protein n=1 Tax=Cellulomonas xiejunii TaxID=2968083 RepID=UPI001D0EDEF0|nr:hypothetical protein [Cellulomonas xiejunii]MCC2313188.1 hypothetical protein [Cellulomonas xiejunii]
MDFDTAFWAGVGMASAVATALATGVSTVAAVWWRRQDRQEADWAIYNVRPFRTHRDSHGNEPSLGLDLDVANAGDGVAFRVVATATGGDVRIQGPLVESGLGVRGHMHRRSQPLVPVMPPGEAVHLRIDVAGPEEWATAAVELSWVHPPTWKKRRNTRTLRLLVADLATLPPQRATDPVAGEPAGQPAAE